MTLKVAKFIHAFDIKNWIGGNPLSQGKKGIFGKFIN